MSSLIRRFQREVARCRTRSCLASGEVTLEAAAAGAAGCGVDAHAPSASTAAVARTRHQCREMETSRRKMSKTGDLTKKDIDFGGPDGLAAGRSRNWKGRSRKARCGQPRNI